MVGIDLLPAVIALLEMASKVGRAAGLDVVHGPSVRSWQTMAPARPVGLTVEAEDIRHFQHEDLGEESEVWHELVEGIGQGGLHLPGQVRVKLGSAGAAVAEVFLNDPEVEPRFQ